MNRSMPMLMLAMLMTKQMLSSVGFFPDLFTTYQRFETSPSVGVGITTMIRDVWNSLVGFGSCGRSAVWLVYHQRQIPTNTYERKSQYG